MRATALLCLAVAPWSANAAELVKRCDLESKPVHRVEIVREARLGPTFVYFVKEKGKTRPIFANREDSRGSSVKVLCVGRRHRALVLVGEFSANALQGFALRHDPALRRTERFDFAEKRLPERLYLGSHATWVLIPTGGLGETGKKDVIHRSAARGIGNAQVDAIDEPPPSAGLESLPLWPTGRRIR